MAEDWLETLKKIVHKRPLVIIQFWGEEWSRLRDSRRGVSEFTVARSHDMLEGVRVPTACLIFGVDEDTEETVGYFGMVASRQAVSTLDSRVKIKRAARMFPPSIKQLLELVVDPAHAANIHLRLRNSDQVIPLSPELSEYLVGKLAEIESNSIPMRAVMASLSSPKYFDSIEAMQEDAVQVALRAFGLSPGDQATSVKFMNGDKTALARVSIVEDAVVEHDARHVPGYDFVDSDVTGHAVFEKGPERLDIFTANRRPLEKVFGVDLVYLNATKQNVVMVQYKMLEPLERSDGGTDWIYRPDANLDSEIERMRKFSSAHSPGVLEYRINPQVFYMKFVKRDGALKNSSIIMPIDHFEQVRSDPASRGPRDGVRVSFDTLGGRYLRQGSFVDLIRSGYIGSHAKTTSHLKTLVDAIVRGDRALVAAIHTQVKYDEVTSGYDADDSLSDLDKGM